MHVVADVIIPSRWSETRAKWLVVVDIHTSESVVPAKRALDLIQTPDDDSTNTSSGQASGSPSLATLFA